MAQVSVDFSVIKQKIIKTDELLRKYQETNNKLKKVTQAYREVKSKHDQAVLNINRIEIEKERCNFTLENMRLNQNLLENENKELCNQKSLLEDKYNHQSIQCQLEIQKLRDELFSLQMNENDIAKKKRKEDKKVKALEDGIKKLKGSETEYKKEIDDLYLRNEKLLEDLNSSKEHYSKSLTSIEMKNKELLDKIATLDCKVKEHKSVKANGHDILTTNLNHDKDIKINELNKKICLLTMDKNKVKVLEEENERLKRQLMSQELNSFSGCEYNLNYESSTQTDLVPNNKFCNDHAERQRDIANKEIISLRKKIACLTIVKNKLRSIETENETLKQKLLEQELNLAEVKEKKSNSDFGVQTTFEKKSTCVQTLEDMRICEERLENEKLKQSLTEYDIQIKVLQEKLQNTLKESVAEVSHTEEEYIGDISLTEDENIEDILREMRASLPRILSPMSPASCIDLDIILPPGGNKKTLELPLLIPEVIVTPPTPTVEKVAAFKHIDDDLDMCNAPLETTLGHLNSETCSNGFDYFKRIRRKKYRSPFLSSEFVRLTNNFHRRPIIINPLMFKKKMRKAKKARNQDCVLRALQTLKRSKINFTISNESILPKRWLNDVPNEYPLIYSNPNPSLTKFTRSKAFVSSRNYKNTKRLTEHLVCGFSSCDKDNSYMLLNRRKELLGFFSVKDETITPSGSRIGNVSEQKPFDILETLNSNMKNSESFLEILAEMVSRKLKEKDEMGKRRPISSETFESFNSETEPELERLLGKPKDDVLKRNKSLLQQAQQHVTSKKGKDDISPSEMHVPNDVTVSETHKNTDIDLGNLPQNTSKCNAAAKEFIMEDSSCDSMKFSTCPDLLSPMSSISKVTETPHSKRDTTYFEPNFDVVSKTTPTKKMEHNITPLLEENKSEIDINNTTVCFSSSCSVISATSSEDIDRSDILNLKSLWDSPAKSNATPNKSKNNLEIFSPNEFDVSFLEREYSLLTSPINLSRINRSILFDEEVENKKSSNTEDSCLENECSLDAPQSPIQEDFDHVNPIDILLEKSSNNDNEVQWMQRNDSSKAITPNFTGDLNYSKLLRNNMESPQSPRDTADIMSPIAIPLEKPIDINSSNNSNFCKPLKNLCTSNTSTSSAHSISVDEPSCPEPLMDNVDGPLSPIQEEINHKNPIIVPLEKSLNKDDEDVTEHSNSSTLLESNTVDGFVPLMDNSDGPQSPVQEEKIHANPIIIIPLEKSSEDNITQNFSDSFEQFEADLPVLNHRQTDETIPSRSSMNEVRSAAVPKDEGATNSDTLDFNGDKTSLADSKKPLLSKRRTDAKQKERKADNMESPQSLRVEDIADVMSPIVIALEKPIDINSSNNSNSCKSLENFCTSNTCTSSAHLNSVDEPSCPRPLMDNVDGPLSPIQEEINHINLIIIPLEKSLNKDDENVTEHSNSSTVLESNTVDGFVPLMDNSDGPQSPVQEEKIHANPIIIIPLEKSSEDITQNFSDSFEQFEADLPVLNHCQTDETVPSRSSMNEVRSAAVPKDEGARNSDTLDLNGDKTSLADSKKPLLSKRRTDAKQKERKADNMESPQSLRVEDIADVVSPIVIALEKPIDINSSNNSNSCKSLENFCTSNKSTSSAHLNSVDEPSCPRPLMDNVDGPLSPIQEEINHINRIIIPLEKSLNKDDKDATKHSNSSTLLESNTVDDFVPLMDNSDGPQSPVQEESIHANPIIIIPLEKLSEEVNITHNFSDSFEQFETDLSILNHSPREDIKEHLNAVRSPIIKKCKTDETVSTQSSMNEVTSAAVLKDEGAADSARLDFNGDKTSLADSKKLLLSKRRTDAKRKKRKAKRKRVVSRKTCEDTDSDKSLSFTEEDIGGVGEIEKDSVDALKIAEPAANSLTHDSLDALKYDDNINSEDFNDVVPDVSALGDLRMSKSFFQPSNETVSSHCSEKLFFSNDKTTVTKTTRRGTKREKIGIVEYIKKDFFDFIEIKENAAKSLTDDILNALKRDEVVNYEKFDSSVPDVSALEIFKIEKSFQRSNETISSHCIENNSQLGKDISETNESNNDTSKAVVQVSKKRKSSSLSSTVRRSARNLEKNKRLLEPLKDEDNEECACVTNDSNKQTSESSDNRKRSKKLDISQTSDSKNVSLEMVIQVKRKRGRPRKKITESTEPSEDVDQGFLEINTQSEMELEAVPIKKKKDTEMDAEEGIPSQNCEEIKFDCDTGNNIEAVSIEKKKDTELIAEERIPSENCEEIKSYCDTGNDTIRLTNLPSTSKQTNARKRRNMTKLKSSILKQFKEKRKMFQSNVQNANFVNVPIVCDVPKPNLDIDHTNVNVTNKNSTRTEQCATVCDVELESHVNKIKIVQNIMIPPNSNFAVDLLEKKESRKESKCDIRLDLPSTSRGSISVGDSAQDNKTEKKNVNKKETENEGSPPKKKKVSRVKTKENTNDVLSKIMDDMSRGKPSVPPSKPKPNKVREGIPASIVEKEWRKNLLDIAEITHNIAEDETSILFCHKASYNFVKSPKGIAASKVKLLLSRLRKLSSEERIATEVILEFKRLEVDKIVEIILHKVSQDTVDKVDGKYYPAPLMTTTQRTLLNLMVQLENENVENLLETFLSKAETFLLKITCGLKAIVPVTRLYVAVCRLLAKVNRVRQLCCNAFLFIGDLAVPLLFTVLTSWSEILPMESDLKYYPMTKVLVHIVHLKGCGRPGYNLRPLKMFLHQFYGYPKERWNCDELFEELFQQYLSKPDATADVAVRLLCRNKDSKWVYKKVNEFLKPLIYKIPENNVNFRATAILLIAKICKHFRPNEELDETYLNDLQRWLIGLTEGENIPDIIKRSVYLSLSMLPKKKEKRVKISKPRAANTVTRKKGKKSKQFRKLKRKK